ncbi:TPA: TIGR03905 family protein [Candidatus Gastranaerophilales bacterium HUM_9]|nr:MAG TPA: TIGR03905 family protein [Candidatus Gastranaerophilales bacterium HUM_9]HBX34898.1 TIGR03905 family TSCPD domain-containing protein [Cyanobacteria bacterium UBA11440]
MQYATRGTCSKMIGVEITDDVITNIEFIGGCQGNLTGISKLVVGMNVDEVINRLEGIDCGGRGTSCPDQLAKCLIEYKNKKLIKN